MSAPTLTRTGQQTCSRLSLAAATLHPLAPAQEHALRDAITRGYCSGSMEDLQEGVLNAVAAMRLPTLVALDELEIAIAVLTQEWNAALLDEDWSAAYRLRDRVGQLTAARTQLTGSPR